MAIIVSPTLAVTPNVTTVASVSLGLNIAGQQALNFANSAYATANSAASYANAAFAAANTALTEPNALAFAIALG